MKDLPAILLLWPLAVVYGIIVWLRTELYRIGWLRSHSAGVPVISIGNITVGGTGKTPMAIHVAQILMKSGIRVAIVSRGYKRVNTGKGERGIVVSDGIALKCTVDESGDEPYMMAVRLLGSKSEPGAMVIVGKDRVAGAKKAVELGAQAIILDDGFQHLRLKRDLDIVLIDCQRPFGNTLFLPQQPWSNGWLLPVGRLREPVSALPRADEIIWTRRGEALAENYRADYTFPMRKRDPIFTGFFTDHKSIGLFRWSRGQMLAADVGSLSGKRSFLFSGIARPQSFRRSVEAFGLVVAGNVTFPDHHDYAAVDLGGIVEAATGADCIMTTEKDAVRLPHDWDPGKPLYVLRVGIEFVEDAARFESMILSAAKTPPQPLSAAERGSA